MNDKQGSPPPEGVKPFVGINGNGTQPPSDEHEQASTQESPQVKPTRQPNAYGSTGPRTPQGKQRSKFNALKHGFFSKEFPLKGESRAEYLAILNGFHEQYRPETTHKKLEVEYLAQLWWRQRRLFSGENAGASNIDARIEEALSEEIIPQFDCGPRDGISGEEKIESKSPADPTKVLIRLIKLRIDIEDDNLDDKEKLRIRGILDEAEKVRIIEKRTTTKFLELLLPSDEVPKTREKPENPDQLMAQMCQQIDAQIKDYFPIFKLQSDQAFRGKVRLIIAACTPPPGESDRLMRNEAHIRREIERTTNRLDRM